MNELMQHLEGIFVQMGILESFLNEIPAHVSFFAFCEL